MDQVVGNSGCLTTWTTAECSGPSNPINERKYGNYPQLVGASHQDFVDYHSPLTSFHNSI